MSAAPIIVWLLVSTLPLLQTVVASQDVETKVSTIAKPDRAYCSVLKYFSLMAINWKQVYTVYMEERKHSSDVELATKSHHEMLASVLGSKGTTVDSMIHSYRHDFCGFAEKLTESQAQYIPGIWPKSKSFSNDNGLGPIPAKWKGFCQSGDEFDPSKHCNKKLIGACHFIKGFLVELDRPFNATKCKQHLKGQAMFVGKDTDFVKLTYRERVGLEAQLYRESITVNDTWVARKVVLYFTLKGNDEDIGKVAVAVANAGGLGIIVTKNTFVAISSCYFGSFPLILVTYDVATQILNYIRFARDLKVRLKPTKTYIDEKASTCIALFSSSGPHPLYQIVTKPDVAIPGVDILAAYTPRKDNLRDYIFNSGASMVAYHIVGVVALLKSLHPNWSPATIKSAFITTAWTNGPYPREPTFERGDTPRIVDPFDYGGGLVNPNAARNRGLVYDMGTQDYINYLCAMGYTQEDINQLSRPTKFYSKSNNSILNLSLPSITVLNLKGSVTTTRTITSVGNPNSKYETVIVPPLATIVKVNPTHLLFNPKVKKLSFTVVANKDVKAKKQVYIVYMGERKHKDVELVTRFHYEMLASVLGSKEAAADSMIYSYRHGFSGFAAKMTKPQAQYIAELPGVVQVFPNYMYKLHTTRSWDFLGQSPYSTTNLLHDANQGDGAIIGVIDSGIRPESESFTNDNSLDPIPTKWKGFCQSGHNFDPSKHCNKKLIGARYFIEGFLAELEEPFNATKNNEYLSPRDSQGHGTHCASIAAGSFVNNVNFKGLANGTARGGAPKARLAVYKVIWSGVAASADVLKAFDEAIHDGVDVLSVSLGIDLPLYPEIDKRDLIYYGSFHAVHCGIIVVCSGGNNGPESQTVEDVAPWVISVAASTIDRLYPTPITLGNNQTLEGQAMFVGKDNGFVKLAYKERVELKGQRYCESITTKDTWIAGKVVLCFTVNSNERDIRRAAAVVQKVSGLGIIVSKNTFATICSYYKGSFPLILVTCDVATQILNYIHSTSDPKVRLTPSETYIGEKASTYIAFFSSRGPNSLSPTVLKPDIAAPGIDILAAYIPTKSSSRGYVFNSGTSMAAPHIAGIVALLKSLHQEWSPAAIKSALVTTAWTKDPYSRQPIYAKGDRPKIADPFDYGGGLVNPNAARNPGLVYDMGTQDYINYLYAMGYSQEDINQISGLANSFPQSDNFVLDLNLPSITIPNLRSSVTITRTVTNVGNPMSNYQAVIVPPFGADVKVNPMHLFFNRKVKKLSFTISITRLQFTTEYSFGSLTWRNKAHNVTIPLSVRSENSLINIGATKVK